MLQRVSVANDFGCDFFFACGFDFCVRLYFLHLPPQGGELGQDGHEDLIFSSQ